jgi:hypothetical protein
MSVIGGSRHECDGKKAVFGRYSRPVGLGEQLRCRGWKVSEKVTAAEPPV